jgi:hypothetical protein
VRNQRLVLSIAAVLGIVACDEGSSPTSPNCTYAVSPSVLAVGGNGHTSTVTVTTGNSCAWITASNSAFIAVAGGTTGAGVATLTVAANPAALTGGGTRSGTATIAGQTVTVNQADH